MKIEFPSEEIAAHMLYVKKLRVFVFEIVFYIKWLKRSGCKINA